MKKNAQRKKRQIYPFFAVFLVVAGIFSRLLPHPANFSPLASIALFSGKEFPKKISLPITLIILLISDAVIGFYSWKIMLAVYISFIFINWLGQKLTNHFTAGRLAGFTLLSSCLFFIITNAAVWAFSPLYPHTGSGLILAYYYALPFFRNTLLGNIFYVILIFGLSETMKKIIVQKELYAYQTTQN